MDSRDSAFGRRAFTLVELLAVVSIIALLLAILLPSLKEARRHARSIRCGSNLHTLSHALQLFAGEYDGAIPRDRGAQAAPFAIGLARMLDYPMDRPKSEGPVDSIVANWRTLEDQMRAVPELQCPDFPEDNFVGDGDLAWGQPLLGGGLLPDQPVDFVVNGFPILYTPKEGDEPLDAPDLTAQWKSEEHESEPPMKLSLIRNASSRIYLSEAHRLLPTTAPCTMHDVWLGSHLPRGQYPRVATDVRHPGGINSVFFDCHVERTLPGNMNYRHWYSTPVMPAPVLQE